MECRERVEQYLSENGVPFEVMAHDLAYTMQEAAAKLHVSGKQVAKAVMVKAGEALVMFAIPAPSRLDLDQAREALSTDQARLARESEFAATFPDCVPGAMPLFGNLYGVPVYVDQELAQVEELVFRVGTHEGVMKVAYDDFQRLAQPTVGQFAYLP